MKENGELTDDPAEQAEILKKQYESVASKPMEEFKVKEDFFIENTPDQTNDEQPIGPIETCLTDVTLAQPFVSDCINMLSAGVVFFEFPVIAKMMKAVSAIFGSAVVVVVTIRLKLL